MSAIAQRTGRINAAPITIYGLTPCGRGESGCQPGSRRDPELAKENLARAPRPPRLRVKRIETIPCGTRIRQRAGAAGTKG
jgi:hypothetical protein